MAKAKKMRKTVRTRPWDLARHIRDDADRAAYLQAALEEDDPRVIVSILGAIARSRGMTEVARKTGLGRESLYKALSETGNPSLATALQVIRAVGLRLRVSPA
jgi:probable addiction module antidote protein